MITLLRTTILGPPVGQGRARIVRQGPFVRMHSAPKSATWESLAATHFDRCWRPVEGAEDQPPHDGPVRLHVTAVSPRPKTVIKRAGSGRQWKTTKPDLDNIVKLIADALVKAGVLRDDVLISSLRADSFVAAHDEAPCVVVLVESLEPLPVVAWPEKARTKRAVGGAS